MCSLLGNDEITETKDKSGSTCYIWYGINVGGDGSDVNDKCL
jgi:hypothetical protein